MMIKVQHSTPATAKSHCYQPTLVLRKHPFRPSLRSRALFSSLRKQKRTSSAEKKVVTATKSEPESEPAETRTNKYDEQKRKRLNHMPWLYDIEKHKAFAMQWQKDVQEKLMELETIEFIGADTFIADVNVNVFAERGRKIVVNNNCRIAANVYLHGPIEVGENVSINQHCHMEGPIWIGSDTRIGPSTSIFAFNHNFDDAETPVRLQKVKSEGVHKNIPEYEIWAGNPCKKIGERKRPEE